MVGVAANRHKKGDRERSRTRTETRPQDRETVAEPVVETRGENSDAVVVADKGAEKKPAAKKEAPQDRSKDQGEGRDIRELAKEVDWESAPETEMARLLREALEGKKGSED